MFIPRVTVEYSAGLFGRTKSGPPPVISCSHCVFDEANDPSITSGYYIIGVDFEYEKVKQIKVWEIEFDKMQKKWYHNPKKKTYRLGSRIGHQIRSGTRSLMRKNSSYPYGNTRRTSMKATSSFR